MLGHQESIYARDISPLLQAGLVLGLILLFNIVSRLLSFIDFIPIKKGAPWLIFTAFILVYALINSILSISAKSRNRYWFLSIVSYVLLLIGGGVIAYLFSGLTMDQAGSYKWILFVFTFAYILFLSIVRAMIRIVNIAENQDKRLRGEE